MRAFVPSFPMFSPCGRSVRKGRPRRVSPTLTARAQSQFLWVLLAAFVCLLPRVTWAFESQEKEPASTLRETAEKLHLDCKDKPDLAAQADVSSFSKLTEELRKIDSDLARSATDRTKAKTIMDALNKASLDLETALTEAGRINSLEPLVADLRKKIKEAKDTATARGKVCDAYCKPDAFINICAFHDDLHLARVAYATDSGSVTQALDAIEKLAPALTPEKAGSSRAPGPVSTAFFTTEGLTELAIRFATALGKLAIDRAKQEAVLWALGEIGDRFCGNDRPGDVPTAEIRKYWLPRLCLLSTEENLQSGFGAGQAMLRALVSAVEDDAKHLPGAAAGLVMGMAYWSEDMGTADHDGAFECAVTSATTTKECERLAAIRSNTADAIGGLLEGKSPVDAARSWSAELDETNRVLLDDGKEEHVLEAPLTQLIACGVAIAAELSAGQSHRALLASEQDPSPERYHVIGVLVSAPACWTLTGRGWRSADEGATGESKGCKANEGTPVKCLALDRTNGRAIERLSTVIRLHESLKQSEIQTRDAWTELFQVIRRLQSARERFETAVKKARESTSGETTEATLAAIAKLDPTKLKLEDMRALLDEAKLDQARDHLSTALEVADELLVAIDAVALLLEAHSNEDKLRHDLFPGLQERMPDRRTGKGRDFPMWTGKGLHDSVQAFRIKLTCVQELVGALREILAGDWAAGSTKTLAAVRHILPRKAQLTTATARGMKDDLEKVIGVLEAQKNIAGNSKDIEALDSQIRSVEQLDRRFTARRLVRTQDGDVVTTLGELIGLFTAILSAKDSDDIAVVLEKTASPPGSWRRKQAPGAFTLSLGSHVGVYTAAEFRWGQYGVNRERGALHGQAPTLAVPIGFDFAWGAGARGNSLGFFLPIIDPAAFVQYDVSEQGRLPGPRPLTVLSPGAFFRWGIFRSPITLLLGYTYRPRLRTWEATINEPGADAHQLGVSLAIDATFWNIVKR